MSTSPNPQVKPKKTYPCKCELHCGGPNGPGVELQSYSTHRRHIRDNAAHLTARSSLALQLTSASSKGASSLISAKSSRISKPKRKKKSAPLPGETPSQRQIHNGMDLDGIGAQELQGASEMPQLYNPEQDVDMSNNEGHGFGGLQDEGDSGCTPPIPDSASATGDLRDHDVPPELENDNAPDGCCPNFIPRLDDIKISLAFIDLLKNATLNTPLDLSDRDVRLSIELFLANSRASDDTYTETCEAITRAFPETRLLSLHEVKKLVEEISGVTPIWRDMCPNTCIAYTGPFAELENCTWCGEDRYRVVGKKKVPRQQYPTIPIGPMLQALNRTQDGANAMDYHTRYTEELLKDLRENDGSQKSPYHDFFDGSDYLEALRSGKIGSDDICMMMSIDGAQLYRNKASDCWMWIWVILNLDPASGRYKVAKIIPGGSIPGPNKPKHLDSFIFPSLYHFVALAREGLKIWKANKDLVVLVRLFLALVTADGPGMACLNGLVGHQGRIHCRSFCGISGRHKDGHSHYYPVCLKPDNFTVEGSSHKDVNLFELLASLNSNKASRVYHQNLETLVNSPNKTQYEKRRLETGIIKPSIFSGFPSPHILGIPHIFSGDIMHLPCLNIPDLMIPLWRGKFDCDKTDSIQNWPWVCFKDLTVWKAHGEDVANCTPYIPGSFDRPPRNPAEKISSRYKAWEFLLYFYGLGPCLFYGHLPDVYWKSYCKSVRSIQISLQVEVTQEENNEALDLCCEFSDEFEKLYYARRPDRIHMIRPAIHAISHIALDTARIGPGIIYSQWTMEHMIGVLGDLVMQPSNPYANLANRLIRLAQVNALKAMDPTLQTESKSAGLPRGAKDIGGGYSMQRAMDTAARAVSAVEMVAIRQYLQRQGVEVEENYTLKVTRWARVGLPNGQIARSRWKEELKPSNRLRRARNVQVNLDSKSRIAEVHFYMSLEIGGIDHHLAIASFYGPPNPRLYQESSGTYITMPHARDVDVRVVLITSIKAVVMMAPDPRYHKFFGDGESGTNHYFMMSKPGLKISEFMGLAEEDVEE
ncbi:hypothetical protein VNI00_016510 [Paramarasmius palmivorus]|uniref:Uncharacterized protein n=1 Tax=Paramarasmius palmivorus TaxID=297713 RepID=A0AAW0BED4_9AGAR